MEHASVEQQTYFITDVTIGFLDIANTAVTVL